jgi:EmrB/QacA subfamily drug resistance transporter
MTQAWDDRLDPALRRLIAVILLGGMLGILNSTMVAVAINVLTSEFSTSLSTIGWVSTGFLLAVTATIPFTTWAVDRFGSRRMWLAGLALFLLASLLCAVSWNVGSLITFRIVQGVGAGIIDPLVLVLLARGAGPSRAGRVMGMMGVVLSLGPVLGPVVGGVILDGLGWRWMFLLTVPVGVVAFLLALRVVPADPPTTERPRLDALGLALLGPGFAALVLALSETRSSLPHLLIPLAVAVVLLAGYAIHAFRVPKPLIELRLFANSGFTASVIVMALVGLTTFANLFVLPLYYQQAQGYSVLAAGLLVAPFGLGATVSMPLSGRLSDRIGARSLARGGAVLSALTGLVFVQFGPDTNVAWSMLAALVMGTALGAIGAPTMGSLYRTLPPPLVAQGSSVLYMLNQLGASIGIAVVTLILQTASNPMAGVHGVYWFGIGAIVVILAATPLIPGKPALVPQGEVA